MSETHFVCVCGVFVCGVQEIQQVKTAEELESFMLKHGENIIDTLGAEVDRLEKELKVQDSSGQEELPLFKFTSLI